jgi:hypothetical protein
MVGDVLILATLDLTYIFGSLECISGGLCVIATYRLSLTSIRHVKSVQRE